MRRLRMEALEPKQVMYSYTGWEAPVDITFSYPDDGAEYGNANAELVHTTLHSHLADCEDPYRQIALGMQAWANHGPWNFREVPDANLPFPQRFMVPDAGNHGNIAFTHYLNQGSNDPAYIAKTNYNTTPGVGKAMDMNLRGGMCQTDNRLERVTRHEIGHALGYAHAQGVMAGNGGLNLPDLDADTIQGIHDIYGERQHDAFDAASSNDSWASPSFLWQDEATADRTHLQDLDLYSFRADTDQTTLRVTSLSLLAPAVAAYSGAGLLDAAAADYGGVAEITVDTVPGRYYGLLVNANDADFAIGKYQINIEHIGGGSGAAEAVAIDYAIEDSTWDLQRLRNSSAQSMRH